MPKGLASRTDKASRPARQTRWILAAALLCFAWPVCAFAAGVDVVGSSASNDWSWNASVTGHTARAMVLRKPSRGRSGHLSRASVIALAERCAPTTPAGTLASLSQVESALDPLTIHDNTSGRSYHPSSSTAALALASDLIARVHNIDLGLAQINNRNLRWLGLDIVSAFDACSNLAAAGRVIDTNYANALKSVQGAPLLQTAYSIYNTGRRTRGFHNGYADKVVAATQRATR